MVPTATFSRSDKGLTMAGRQLRARDKVAAVPLLADISPEARRNRLRELLSLLQPPIADNIDTFWSLSKSILRQRRILHENRPPKHLAFNGRHRHIVLDEVCIGALKHLRDAEGYIAEVRASL